MNFPVCQHYTFWMRKWHLSGIIWKPSLALVRCNSLCLVNSAESCYSGIPSGQRSHLSLLHYEDRLTEAKIEPRRASESISKEPEAWWAWDVPTMTFFSGRFFECPAHTDTHCCEKEVWRPIGAQRKFEDVSRALSRKTLWYFSGKVLIMSSWESIAVQLTEY